MNFSTAADSTGPEVALDPSEQREGLDILRRIDQYAGDEESSPLIVDLQARVAVIFDGWAKGMVAEGRSQELRDTLVHVVGEEYADTFMASLGPAEPKPKKQKITGSGREAGSACAGLTVLNQSPTHTYTRRTIILQSSEEIFTTEEKEYLEKYGDLFTQLMNGEREPSTDAQKRFVEVSHGRCDPETEYEQLWWKYIQRIKV